MPGIQEIWPSRRVQRPNQGLHCSMTYARSQRNISQEKVIFLENVLNLVGHDKEYGLPLIEGNGTLTLLNLYWPHDFGTCQLIKRVYVVCIRETCKGIDFIFPDSKDRPRCPTVLDENVDDKYNMNEDELYWLNMWEDFLKNVNKESSPGHPIWSDCYRMKEISRYLPQRG